MKIILSFFWAFTFCLNAYAECAGRFLRTGSSCICMTKSDVGHPAFCAKIVNDKYCVALVAGISGYLHAEINGENYSFPEFINPQESIYFDGNSYIDLGFPPTTDLSFEIKAWLDTSVPARDGALIGSRLSGSNQQYVVWYNNVYYLNGELGNMAPRLFVPYKESINDIFNIENIPQVIRWDKEVFSINDVVYQIEYFAGQDTRGDLDLVLGGLRHGSENNIDERRFLGHIYYAKFWNADGVIADLIAATDCDGVSCMYDRVSGRCLYLKN